MQNTITKHDKPAFLKHKDLLDVKSAKEDHEVAVEEWNQLATRLGIITSPTSTPVITPEKVFGFFKNKDMKEYLQSIKPVIRRNGLSSIIHWLVGPPKLKVELVPERNLVFAVAQCPLDDKEDVHMQIVQTIFKCLTGQKMDCPRYGSHWEQIGFQGNDPATDLRGTGLLGLLHLLYFILDSSTSQAAKKVYQISQDEIQNFPFCLMSINMTRIALEVLREELLNKECNQRNQVMIVVNEFYAGTFLHLYQTWKKHHKTIIDTGYVIKAVTDYVKKNVKTVIESTKDFKDEEETKSGVVFTDIGGLLDGPK
ncbi:ELMO domain-containing protein 3-like isoform X3 [Tachypleus tridentatus]